MLTPKIARGTTGRTLLGQINEEYGVETFDAVEQYNDAWVIFNSNRSPTADSNEPFGWSFSGDGIVSVPSNSELYNGATINNELGSYEAWSFSNCNFVDGATYCLLKSYVFEVVCMTTKITVTETYRDENVYRLTCTTTPQGGTAPYTYNWSSTPNGSQALSATNQATLEVEIPVIGVGTISVAVSDSSTPPCTASASFDVCGSVKCDFTTSLISTPPTGDTGPYIYECVSRSISGFGDLVHEWSPSPIEVSADGRVAKFSFPDDDEHSIDLTVTDASECRGFKTHKVGGYEFTISTDPSGEDTGTITGTRDTMQFTVTVTAQATGNFTGTPPSQLTFEFSRPAANQVGTATAPLVAGSTPPRYELPWAVQQAKGRWQIKVQGYKSNTVTFKVDKRKQIVEVAQSWVGMDIGPNCYRLVDRMYTHVGLSLGMTAGDGSQLWMASDDNPAKDSLPGAIVFYRSLSQLSATWTDAKIASNGSIASHAALRVQNGIVDTNCGTTGFADPYTVHLHSNANDPLEDNPGRTPQNPALDIRDRTPQQLADLDEE